MVSVMGALALAGLNVGSAAAQEQTVKLFKIVSPKDEIVIGVKAQDLRSGPGTDLENLASALTGKGQLSAWQYAVKKSDDGSLRQAPLRQIVVLKHDTIRIEPLTSPLPVTALPAE